jgi:acyl-[acyl-carrier-protein]-phospholipid O-acyltransferase/long-chain-fatty-acid--[acyl-carrier-protein] ligase
LIKRRETAGVLLPTGVGCTVTFFALHAIGRTPAMLNFTAGAMNLRAACEAANVRKILTSGFHQESRA